MCLVATVKNSAENISIITESSVELCCPREKGRWGAEEEGGNLEELPDQPSREEKECSTRKSLQDAQLGNKREGEIKRGRRDKLWGKNSGLILALPPTKCVAMSQLGELSEPQSPHQGNGGVLIVLCH